MTRQSVSFTIPNSAWLQSQIDNKEYKNKSEIINDLVRKARIKQAKVQYIRSKLIQAEQNGFVSQSQKEILSEIKQDVTKGVTIGKEI